MCIRDSPGPGLAIRIIGAVTPEKVKMVQQADAIYREEVEAAGAHRALGQYFAALTNMRSAVSYTHLDVYKRQDRGPCGREEEDRCDGP